MGRCVCHLCRGAQPGSLSFPPPRAAEPCVCFYSQRPGHPETQRPKGPEARRPRGLETQRPGGREARRPQEARGPRGQEAWKPGDPKTWGLGGPETKDPETWRPGGQEARRPGGQETRRPGGPETQRPGGPEARRPGDPETQRPRDGEARRPGGLETHQPEPASQRHVLKTPVSDAVNPSGCPRTRWWREGEGNLEHAGGPRDPDAGWGDLRGGQRCAGPGGRGGDREGSGAQIWTTRDLVDSGVEDSRRYPGAKGNHGPA